MKERATWNVKGLPPEARDAARDAAKRSGMSVGQWLNSAIQRSASGEPAHAPQNEAMARRMDQALRRPPTDAPADPHYAPAFIPGPQSGFDPYAAASPYPPQQQSAPPMQNWTDGLDNAVAEIAERQRVLDSEPATMPAPTAPRHPADAWAGDHARVYPPLTPPPAPIPPQPSHGYASAPSQSTHGLEAQLRHITHQIEQLHRPTEIEAAIMAVRAELAAMNRAVTEAMPRRAVEALEGELQKLATRIDQTRPAVDPSMMEGMERGLLEVRDALGSLTPAENLVGFDQAVRDISLKVDALVARPDPVGVEHLERAINTLRSISANVASNDALSKLSDEMRGLAAKVDRVATQAQQAANPAEGSALAKLERRVGALSEQLKINTSDGKSVPPQFESLINAVSQRVADLPMARGDQIVLGQLENRIVSLVEKLDASDARLASLGAIERGLADVLLNMEQLKGSVGLSTRAPVDTVTRELARTQDSLENAHGTLDQVVDRIATIESGMRERPVLPVFPMPEAAIADLPPANVIPPMPSPSLAPPITQTTLPSAIEPQDEPAPAPKVRPPRADYRPLDPNLPPDHPLEPGMHYPQTATPSAAERVAASEAALGPTRTATQSAAGQSNFIAAARRAAQAASQSQDARQAEADAAQAEGKKTLAKRVRNLFASAGVVVLMFGGIRVVSNMIEDMPPEAPAAAVKSETKKTAAVQPVAPRTAQADSDPAVTGSIANMPSLTAPILAAPPLVTPPPLSSAAPAPDKFPQGLLAAANAGDPRAQFEAARHIIEDRAEAARLPEAVRYLEQAAQAGVTPAQFRLANLYEKGLGVRKDLATARKFYTSAAERGNAKAAHNLAVLYAEGAEGKPDYKSASIWFRKAAEYGVADSQYNLGILFARGIGVEANLSESYKWFSLAAAQGDRESGKKREEVAARLDAASLAAAKREAETFKPLAEPENATKVATPANGWGKAESPKPRKKAPGPSPLKISPS